MEEKNGNDRAGDWIGLKNDNQPLSRKGKKESEELIQVIFNENPTFSFRICNAPF